MYVHVYHVPEMSEKRGQVRGKKGALPHMRKGVILGTRITQISEKNRSSEGRERWAYLWKGLIHMEHPNVQRKGGQVKGGEDGLICGRGSHMDHTNFREKQVK